MGAYFEMFLRDRGRLSDIRERMNYCPLGSGALAGTTYPLDREYTAELLDFYGPTLNSMDSVSDRDYLIELLSCLLYTSASLLVATASGNMDLKPTELSTSSSSSERASRIMPMPMMERSTKANQ